MNDLADLGIQRASELLRKRQISSFARRALEVEFVGPTPGDQRLL
jgi:hypothetical protein